MSNYIKTIRASVEFDGDTIELSMRPLKRVEFTEIQPLFKVSGDNVEVECGMGEFLSIIQPMVVEAIQTFSGLFIEGEEVIVSLTNGEKVYKNEALFNEVFNSAYFFELIPMIFSELVLKSIAIKDKQDEKKLEEMPSESLAG